MKTLLFLFCTTAFSLTPKNVFSQKTFINVNMDKAVSVDEVFDLIKNQTDFTFIYESDFFKDAPKIHLKKGIIAVNKLLSKCLLLGNLNYVLADDGVIILKEKEKEKEKEETVQLKITGMITDELNMPLPGASIMVKGTKVGTTTSFEGNYSISIPKGATTLVFSYVGYFKQEVLIKGKTKINIKLLPDTAGLDEIVVVGYGKKKKAEIVSSISTVKGKELKFPTRNLTNNIAGQVAGLIAIQRSGEPGYDNTEFWIRGVSTFAGAGASKPLVLVDGIPRSINDIEPDEIETFSILKDASATAVYGAEGANGVVIITSKRGKAQKPVITFRSEHSLSKPTRLPTFVDSADYLELYNEALSNDGESAIFDDELIANYRNNVDADLYPNTNWLDVMLRKVTENERHTVNVRGGTEKSRYFVSGAFYKENGIFVKNPTNRYESNIGVKRFNLRSNVDLNISKTTLLSVDLSGQYLENNYPGTPTGKIFRQMLITPSHVFPAVYSDGTISTFFKERDSNMRNPYNLLINSGYAKEWRSRIQSTVRLEQNLDFITKGLSYRGLLSYDYDGNFSSRRGYNPSRFSATGRDDAGNLIFSTTYVGTEDMSEPTEGFNATKKIYMESSFSYKTMFNGHSINAMVLYMQKESQQHNQALAFRKQGLVGRLNYSFDKKYFIEASFGYTGSEAFAQGNRFGFFPAVGLGYQVSNESFFPESLKKVISGLRFRASIGRTGNDNTGSDRFLYRPTFNFGAAGFNQGMTSGGAVNGLGAGIVEGQFEAPNLGWEIEDKFNVGMNLDLFNNSVSIVADYFNSERSGILLKRRTITETVGFRTSPWENFGKVKNWGVDGSINAHKKINNLDIAIRGTYTFARNKITEFDELEPAHPWMAVTGTRVGEKILYIAERLYTKDDFDIGQNSNGTNSYALKDGIPTPTLGGLIAPGDIKYKDLNSDGVIDSFDRKRGVGNPDNPEIVYGFGINLDYKGLYASAFFQGVANTSILLGGDTGEGWKPFTWGVDQSNFRTFALDRWTEENPSQNVLMPRLHKSGSNGANNSAGSTWWLRDGSFLRLKNVEVGYKFSKILVDKLKVQTARIYLMGYNLHVWDKVKLWDPETGKGNAGLNYPLPSTVTFGIELTL